MPKTISISADAFAAFVAGATAAALAAESNIPAETVAVDGETMEVSPQEDGSITVIVPGFTVDFSKAADGDPIGDAPAPKARSKAPKAPKAPGAPSKPKAPKAGTKVFNPANKGRPPAWFVALSDKDKDAFRKMNEARRKAYMVKIGALKS